MQGMHWLAPRVGEYVPALQFKGEVEAMGQYVPSGQDNVVDTVGISQMK